MSIESEAGNAYSGSNLEASGFLIDNLSSTIDYATGTFYDNTHYFEFGVGDSRVSSRIFADGYIYWALPVVMDYRFGGINSYDAIKFVFGSSPSASASLYNYTDPDGDSYYIRGSRSGFFAVGPYTSVKSIDELQTLHVDETTIFPISDNGIYRLYYVLPFVSKSYNHPNYYKSNCKLNYKIPDITITGFYSSSASVDRGDLKNATDQLDSTLQESNAIAEETKETTKGIFSSITEFFGSFFQNFIDSVIGLFVPSSEEMSGLFDQLNQFFSDRFGFLYVPFDYMIQLLGVFSSAEGSTGLTFPGFSIMGYEVWPDLTYDLASDELVGTIFGYVRIGTGILLSGWFIMFLQDFFKERFSQ